MNRNFSIKALLSALSLSLLFTMACSSGLSKMPLGFEEKISGSETPGWALTPYKEDTGDAKAFCGTSHNFSSEGEARDDALKNARTQIIDAMGTYGTHLVEQVISSIGTAGSILDPGLVIDDATKMLSSAEIKARAREFHVEKWAKKTDQGVKYYYRSHVMILWNNADAEDVLKNAVKKQAEEKTDAATQQNINRALDVMKQLKSEDW
jgi:hypothetical protein